MRGASDRRFDARSLGLLRLKNVLRARGVEAAVAAEDRAVCDRAGAMPLAGKSTVFAARKFFVTHSGDTLPRPKMSVNNFFQGNIWRKSSGLRGGRLNEEESSQGKNRMSRSHRQPLNQRLHFVVLLSAVGDVEEDFDLLDCFGVEILGNKVFKCFATLNHLMQSGSDSL